MNAGKAIYYLLSNATSVTDICGTRIYPELAEQEAPTPFVVYEVISVDPDDTNDGPAKIDEVSMDITAVADNYDTCADLASAIRSAIDRVRGTYNGVNVDSVQYSTTDTDVFDSPRRYAMTAGFIIRISRDDAQIATGQPIDLLTILRLADTPSTYGTEGQALVMNAEGDALEWGDAASALGSLTDVELDDPQDHEALVYDQDTATWINGASTKIGIRVINQTGGTLFAGTPLRATGVQGDQIQVEVYNATQDGKRFIGLLSADLANGETGYARQTGAIYNLNTIQFNVGDILYPSNEFRITIDNGLDFLDTSFNNVSSTQPFAKIPCAIVLRKHVNTGRVYVRTWTPSRALEDLDNVFVSNAPVNSVLRWNGNQWTAGSEIIPSLNDLRDVEITDPELIPNKSLLRWDAVDSIWRVIPETGGTIPALPNNITYFLGRYNDEASTARQAADATLTIERYLTVQADGHGEEITQQSDTPSAGNKIVRKAWYRSVSFADTDVTTWTLVGTYADNRTYAETVPILNALLKGSTYGSIPFTLAQTWEDVPEVNALLDGYTADLAVAIAPVLLVPDYTGDCMRIRRASDNAEQDIGFDGIDLDTAAIATFCAGTDGFVKTWYNQDGSGNHPTQGSNALQPKIYDAATGVVLIGSNAAIDGNNGVLIMPSSVIGSGDYAVFGICEYSDADMLFGGDAPTIGLWTLGGNLVQRFDNETQIIDSNSLSNGDYLLTYQNRTSNSCVVAYNGNLGTSGTNSASFTINRLLGGFGSNTYNFAGKVQAVIIYNADKSADRTAIESALNDYFNIY